MKTITSAADLQKNLFRGSYIPLDSSFTNYPTPFMVTDLADPFKKITTLSNLLPEVKIHYAIKANSDLEIIKKIDKIIEGYDVASVGELKMLLKLGIKPSRILYSNPVKIPAHIEESYALGVRLYALDSLAEIQKLAQLAPGANVYIRLRVSDYGSKFPLSKKFGIDDSHVIDYASMAVDAGLDVIGVTFHVGSQSENVQVWESAIKMAGKTIYDMREKGINARFLNLAGGFPAKYGQPIPPMRVIAATIKRAIRRYVPKDVEIYAEPGRQIVAESSMIVASVIGREHRSGVDWLYLDMGTFQGLIEPLEMPEWRYPMRTDKSKKAYMINYIVSGPSCDACDTLGDGYLLPSDLKIGDKVYIGSTGAYSLVYASGFNGFSAPKVYYLNRG